MLIGYIQYPTGTYLIFFIIIIIQATARSVDICGVVALLLAGWRVLISQ